MNVRTAAFAILGSILAASGVAHAGNEYIFRYKAALVDRSAAGNPSAVDTDGDGIPDVTDPDDDNDGVPDVNDPAPLNANIPHGDGVCQPGETSADCNGICDPATEAGSVDCAPGINAVDIIPRFADGGAVNGEDVPHDPPLTVVATGGSRYPNGSNVVYQCFKASGGIGNYAYELWLDGGDSSWVEAYDVVLKSNLGSPSVPDAQFPPYGPDLSVAPPMDNPQDSHSTFNIDPAGEFCIRVKVKQGAVSGSDMTTEAYVDDYSDSQISGGKMVGDPLDPGMFQYDLSLFRLPLTFRPSCSVGCQ